jgi:hypothetical protein
MKRLGWVPRFLVLLLLGIFLTSCESAYYNMILDDEEPAPASGDGSWDRANDLHRLGAYR